MWQDNSKSRLLDRRRVSRLETEPEHLRKVQNRLKELRNRQQLPRGQDPNGRSESTRYATFVSLQRASNAVAAPDHLTGRRGSKDEEEEPVSPTPIALPSTAPEAKESKTQTTYGAGHPDWQNHEESMSWASSHNQAGTNSSRTIPEVSSSTHSARQNVDALTGAQYPAHDSYQDQVSISYNDQLVLLEQRNKARRAAQRVQAQKSLAELQQFLDQQQHQRQIFQAQQQSPYFESIQRQLRFHNQQQAQANQAQQNSKANNTDTYPLSPILYQSQAADTEIAETSTLPSPSDIINSWIESPKGPDVHTGLFDSNLATQKSKGDSLLRPKRSISRGTSSVTPQLNPRRLQTFKGIDHQIGAPNEPLQGDLDPSLIGRALELSPTISNINQDELLRPDLESTTANEAVVSYKEELCIIKCICKYDESHWPIMFCEGCKTSQHIVCYYRDESVPDVHNCVDCKPRTLVTWDFAKPMDLPRIPTWEEVMDFSTLEQRQALYGDENEFGDQRSESKAPAIHSQPGMNSPDSNSMILKNFMADRLQAANQGHLSIQSTPTAMPVNNEGHFFSHPKTTFIDEEVQKQGPFNKWQADYSGLIRTFIIYNAAFTIHGLDSRVPLRQAAEACLEFDTKLFLKSITKDEYENRWVKVEKKLVVRKIDADRGVGIEGIIDMLLVGD
ncbi:hypothetical protein PMG11_10675 [Penicillium brasilianum]|uniref:Zinc finger PHD-type domain-containing protein n=1 Tax=Penicillium brasilianum TaxID=104259 RepID=A0A0F7U445_PENBI|nr:hypothetical protein PMG11_10675 [Penicillium brasilianum]